METDLQNLSFETITVNNETHIRIAIDSIVFCVVTQKDRQFFERQSHVERKSNCKLAVVDRNEFIMRN